MAKDKSSRKFVHLTFFKLADRSPKLRDAFLAACREYLSEYPEQTHFSVADRAREIDRAVVDNEFDIAMHMIFESKEAYDNYANDKRHNEFITVVAGMSPTRRVFDSYIDK